MAGLPDQLWQFPRERSSLDLCQLLPPPLLCLPSSFASALQQDPIGSASMCLVEVLVLLATRSLARLHAADSDAKLARSDTNEQLALIESPIEIVGRETVKIFAT